MSRLPRIPQMRIVSSEVVMRLILSAAVLCVCLSTAHSQTPFRPFVCRDNGELWAALRKSYDQIQQDRLKTLPWRVFVVMREFQREGFVITPRIRSAICDGDAWLYGERYDQPFLLEDIGPPKGPIQLRDATWNNVG